MARMRPGGLINGLHNPVDTNMGIYKIINTVNKKVYVGSAKNLIVRFREHRKTLSGGVHCNDYLQNAYNKSPDIFIFLLIEYCTIDVLLAREQYWIDSHKSYLREFGYNIFRFASNGGHPMKGKHSSEIAKARIREAQRVRRILRTGQDRKPPTLKQLIAISASGGRSISAEIKLFLSQKTKAWIAINGHPQKGKKKSAESIARTIATKASRTYPSTKGRPKSTPKELAAIEKRRGSIVPQEQRYKISASVKAHQAIHGHSQLGKPKSPESIAKRLATMAANPKPAWNKGLRRTPTEIAQQSAMMIDKFKNGNTYNRDPNTGRLIPGKPGDPPPTNMKPRKPVGRKRKVPLQLSLF